MILVIEDNEDMVFMLNAQVKGWEALIVTNAADGMAQLQVKSFTAVFCDVHGIDKDGFTAHSIVKHCAMIGVPCFITTNDPLAADEFKRTHEAETVDKLTTYRALAGVK